MLLDAGGSGPYNAAVLALPELVCPSSRATRIRGSRLFGLFLLFSCLLFAAAAPASEVYFSPNGGARQRLVRAIQDSRKTIDIAVYNFTAYELADALYAAKARGVQVRVVVDREMAETGGSGVRGLRLNGIPVRSLGVPELSLMHNKFAVFDERLVVTGSYNWTNSAEHANYENLVVLEEPALVSRFQQEFRRLWREARE
ncbi:MAG: phospholipase D family protein [Candidatus Methylomirabilota bacterium]|jgi:phosphatidylserine/phosphatidylglycerophosphate/cardiolipin synthase-like enzyme